MTGLRYWYNGTVYSTSDGLASGPFNTPDRYNGGADSGAVQGSWERTIAIYRSSDTYVVQSRSWLPNNIGGIVWFGPGAAHTSNFVPILVGMLQAPDCLKWGWQGVYDLSSSYWAHRNILNLAQVKFNSMIKDIRQLQDQLESDSQALVNDISTQYQNHPVTPSELLKITKIFTDNAQKSVTSFTELFHYLMYTYADNDLNYWSEGTFHSVSTGYPAWWLEQVGYENGPPPVNKKAVQLQTKDDLQIAHSLVSSSKNKQSFASQFGSSTSKGAIDKSSMKFCVLRCQHEMEYEFCVDKCF